MMTTPASFIKITYLKVSYQLNYCLNNRQTQDVIMSNFLEGLVAEVESQQLELKEEESMQAELDAGYFDKGGLEKL